MTTLEEVLFVGFNRRVVALDQRTGAILWTWKAPKGSGFVSLLVERARIFAAVNGYTYCLDPATGEQVWANPLKGLGVGVATLATALSSVRQDHLGAAAAKQAAAAAAGGAGTTAGIVGASA